MAYGGESNAKKLTRFKFWHHVWGLRWDPEENGERHLSDRVLVIAGPEAADVRVVTALGVPPYNITAVDTDPRAIESAKEHAPHANYVCGDVFEHLKKEGRRRYDVIFLDFCQPPSPGLVDKFVRAANLGLRRTEGIVGIGTMYGREGSRFKKWARRINIDAEEAAKLDTEHTGHMSVAARMRGNFFWTAVERLMTGGRLLHTPAAILTYRSGRRIGKRSNGVPMIYMAFIVRRLRWFRGKYMWARALIDYGDNVGKVTLMKDIGDDPDGEKLKAEALRLRKDKGIESKHVADLLNIKRQQVAAWLAWDTMREREAKAS